MSAIHRILCPTDFSDFSARALRQAVWLGLWHESAITALHVLPPTLPITALMPYPASPWVLEPGARRKAERELEAFVRPAREAGLQADVVLREGGPVAEILGLAARLPADLVVMGTHGRSGFERWVLGSVTDKVMRRARCPVLTVGIEDRSAGTAPFRSIVCAVDFSTASLAALEQALSLGREARGLVTLLHVLEGPSADEVFRRAGMALPDLRRQLAEDARQRLWAAVRPEARQGCVVECVVATGRVHEEIVRLAADRRAQLVVMGVHGRSELGVMVFGSNTRHVIREARCPVLTVRAAPRADRAVA